MIELIAVPWPLALPTDSELCIREICSWSTCDNEGWEKSTPESSTASVTPLPQSSLSSSKPRDSPTVRTSFELFIFSESRGSLGWYIGWFISNLDMESSSWRNRDARAGSITRRRAVEIWGNEASKRSPLLSIFSKKSLIFRGEENRNEKSWNFLLLKKLAISNGCEDSIFVLSFSIESMMDLSSFTKPSRLNPSSLDWRMDLENWPCSVLKKSTIKNITIKITEILTFKVKRLAYLIISRSMIYTIFLNFE